MYIFSLNKFTKGVNSSVHFSLEFNAFLMMKFVIKCSADKTEELKEISGVIL